MALSRPHRAGILLLVLWLTADVAAFGLCREDLPIGVGRSPVIGAVDAGGDGASCCTGHQCFCCSSGAEARTCDLAVDGRAVLMTPQAAPNAPDFSLSDPSPPPRL